jgi:hypothetical protein
MCGCGVWLIRIIYLFIALLAETRGDIALIQLLAKQMAISEEWKAELLEIYYDSQTEPMFKVLLAFLGGILTTIFAVFYIFSGNAIFERDKIIDLATIGNILLA